MKRRIYILICAVILLVSMVACKAPVQEMKAPAFFFYCTEEVQYHEPDGLIKAELRETALINSDLQVLLNAYLAGPVSNEFRSPFPAGMQVTDAIYEDSRVTICVNDALSDATNAKLTIAIVCLSMTAMEYTGATSALILSEGKTLGGKDRILMTQDHLVFMDVTAENNLAKE